MPKKFWSTNISRRRDDCRIWFLYWGGLTFSDTVKKAHLENYRLKHPRPAPPVRQPAPPPPPREPTPSPKRPGRPQRPKPKPGKPKPAGRKTLNSLLAGVTNINKRRKIIREYAKANKQDSGSETEMEFKTKAKKPCGKLNIKDFVIRRCKPKNVHLNVLCAKGKIKLRGNTMCTQKKNILISDFHANIVIKNTRHSMLNGNMKVDTKHLNIGACTKYVRLGSNFQKV